jgi:hypothetical protein
MLFIYIIRFSRDSSSSKAPASPAPAISQTAPAGAEPAVPAAGDIVESSTFEVLFSDTERPLGLEVTSGIDTHLHRLAVVTDVVSSSYAETHGVKVQDVIASVNGTPVNSYLEFTEIISKSVKPFHLKYATYYPIFVFTFQIYQRSQLTLFYFTICTMQVCKICQQG